MKNRESLQLIGGPYKMPRCRVGGILTCEARGRDVKVGGIHDALISWPFMAGRARTPLILCGDLIRAVRTEAARTVAYYWGVSRKPVHLWRRALDVPKYNVGSRRLIARIVSVARRGRPLSPKNRAAISRALRNRPKSKAWKRASSASLKKQWAPGGIRRVKVEKRRRKRRRAAGNR